MDREGKSLRRSWIVIVEQKQHLPPAFEYQQVTGDDGRFQYDGLVPGQQYRLKACADGFAWSMTEFVSPQEEAVRIALSPAKTLTGRAVDADGKPLENVDVRLHLTEAAVPPHDRTGPDGRFSLRPLGATSGELVAVWRDVVDHVCNRKQVVRRAAISVADEGLTLEFAKALAIAGTSVAVDGQWVRRIGVQAIPVAQAKGELDLHGPWCAGRFSRDGSFRIEGLEKGRYRLVGWSGDANGWSGPPAAAVSGTVEVEAGTTDVVLKLAQPR